jgi:hypothetical protein
MICACAGILALRASTKTQQMMEARVDIFSCSLVFTGSSLLNLTPHLSYEDNAEIRPIFPVAPLGVPTAATANLSYLSPIGTCSGNSAGRNF